MSAPAGGSTGPSTATRAAADRWALLLSPLAVPWVVTIAFGTTLVFPWGMASVETGHAVSLPAYLDGTAGLPRHLRMWPLGALCYALALAWAAGRRIGLDQRVTAGLFVLAALAAGWLAAGLSVEPNRTAIPLGSIHLLALALWTFVAEA